VSERRAVFEAAASWRREVGDERFLLLGGTGCASLPDTVAATESAFELGLDSAVVLPPFYYRDASTDGLIEYFGLVIEGAVPDGGRMLAYHIPRVSGVAVPLEVVDALRVRFPGRFAGLKDSGLDLEYTREICRADRGLTVFTGTDTDLAATVEAGGAGSITALANVAGDLARQVFDERGADRRSRDADIGARSGERDLGAAASSPGADAQRALARARRVLDDYPAVPAIKALLADMYGLPHWPVRPPLEDLSEDARRGLRQRMSAALAPPRGVTQ
jgi:4-hydroxy-tetrahydrodipicolinate synthase